MTKKARLHLTVWFGFLAMVNLVIYAVNTVTGIAAVPQFVLAFVCAGLTAWHAGRV